MRINNKKAISFTLVSIILMSIVFLLLLSLGGSIISLINSGTDDLRCTWSAILNSHIKTPFIQRDNFDLDCKINSIFIDIKGRNFQMTYKKDGIDSNIVVPERFVSSVQSWNQEVYSDFSFNNDEHYLMYSFNTLISRELVNCKQKLGDGNLNLFDGFGTVGNICIVCSRVVIPNQNHVNLLDDVTNGRIKGEFLMSNPVSFTNLESQRSFWEELRFDDQSDLFADVNLPIDENMLIIYSVSKDRFEGVPIAGTFFGSNDEEIKHQIFVSNPDDLSSKCDLIAN